MTVAELNKKLNGMANDLKSYANGEILPILASDALAMIRQRVQQTGKDPEGNQFPAYSTKPTLVGASTFVQKAAASKLLGTKPKRKELEWRTVKGKRLAILPGGYKQIRDIQGRQTNFVDFTFTGRMLGNAKVQGDVQTISNNNDHIKGFAIIGATQEEEKKKLAGNTARKGTILGLSQKEISNLSQTYDSLLNKLLKKHGLI